MPGREQQERERIARDIDDAAATGADQRDLLADIVAARRLELRQELDPGARGCGGECRERTERVELIARPGDQAGHEARNVAHRGAECGRRSRGVVDRGERSVTPVSRPRVEF